MKHVVISIILVIVCTSYMQVKGQDKKYKFGTCTEEEMNFIKCAYDSTAPAVVLYDIGSCQNSSENSYFERTTKIKILTAAGLKFAEFSVSYIKGFNNVTKLKANTYNLVNGKIISTPFDAKNNLFDEEVNEYKSNKKFALPEVRVGSVIEVTYTINNISMFSVPSWHFQQRIPVLYSEYSAIIDPMFDFTHLLQGDGTLSDFKREQITTIPSKFGKLNIYPEMLKFVMRDIPGFKDESFIPSMNDYLMKVDFQLNGIRQFDGSYKPFLTTWEKLCEELMINESFGDYIKTSARFGKTIFPGADFSSKSPLEKAKWIDNYLKSNFQYSGYESYFANKWSYKVGKAKKANSAELNLLAIGLMQEAGFEAMPVLLSTRDNGKIIETYPFRDAFNYVLGLVNVDSTLYLMDVTEPMLPFGAIPTNCLVDAGLIVQKDNYQWIDIETTAMSETKYEIDLKPDLADDSVQQSFKVTSTHYDAFQKRKMYKEKYDELAASLLGIDYLSYDSLTSRNLNRYDSAFVLSYHKKSELNKIDNKIVVDPFCGIVLTDNPFIFPTRKYPIDFTYKQTKTFSVSIAVPEGYKLVSKPENLIVNDKRARIVYTVSETEDSKVNVIGVYQFKKDVYPETEYNSLKEYYTTIISKFNEKLIFEPIGI